MKARMRGLALLCLCGITPAAVARAQTPEPYSVAGIGVFALTSPARGPLSEFYTGGSGEGIELSMPLDAGTATLFASRVPYSGKSATYRNFTATEALIGWSLQAPLHSRFSAGAGVRAGEFMMAFDDTVIAPGLRDEKELLLGFTADAALRIAGPISLTARGSYDHVYLHVPTHFLSGQAGIRYTLTLPEWLRGVMR